MSEPNAAESSLFIVTTVETATTQYTVSATSYDEAREKVERGEYDEWRALGHDDLEVLDDVHRLWPDEDEVETGCGCRSSARCLNHIEADGLTKPQVLRSAPAADDDRPPQPCTCTIACRLTIEPA